LDSAIVRGARLYIWLPGVPGWKFVDEIKRSKSSSGKAQILRMAAILGISMKRIYNLGH